jgi:hypothetical protein
VQAIYVVFRTARIAASDYGGAFSALDASSSRDVSGSAMRDSDEKLPRDARIFIRKKQPFFDLPRAAPRRNATYEGGRDAS